MAIYLTVDGGTTNTRIYLVRDGAVAESIRLSVGARNGAEALKAALREGIAQILSKNSLTEGDITRILASGMITSEYGLCKLDHILLPAGKKELAEAMHETSFADVSAIPWSFVRGVKSLGDELSDCDVMRGEETEIMGILEDSGEGALYILPGSHSKHISVDASGRIVAFKTMMSGELFAAVMQNTILRDAADFEHNEIREGELCRGFEYCREHGVNEALFKTRILKNLLGATKEDCYSFLLGTVLCDEVAEAIKTPESTLVISGQKQFCEALAILLGKYSEKRVVALPDEAVASSVALGAVKIYEHK